MTEPMFETLVIATHNKGKATEISALLSGLANKYLIAAALDLPEPEETGDTFIANALLKAKAAALQSGYPALADDSGLAVSALGGAPGIYSARWAGEPRDFNAAMRRVHEELGSSADRGAEFVCALAIVWPDGRELTVEGRAPGQIIWPPRGDRGFGYDPVFVPEGYDMTYAEMNPDEKQSISHRSRAFAALLEVLAENA